MTIDDTGYDDVPDHVLFAGMPHEPASPLPLRVVDGAEAEPVAVSSWRPVDLDEITTAPEATEILTRSDGLGLLYKGRLHWLSGEPESNKTWVALHAIPQVLDAGGQVLVVDYEDDASGFLERMESLSVDARDAARAGQLRYVNPHEGLAGRRGTVTPAQIELASLTSWAPTYAVIDGVTAGMELEGLDPLQNNQIATWLAALAKPLVRAGAAVVCIDHVTKSKDGRDRWAIGGQHKLAAVDGAAYIVETLTPGGRASGSEPVEGTGRLLLAKDRRGYVRGRTARAPLAPVADITITAYPDGGVTIDLAAPGRGGLDRHQAAVIAHLAVYDGATKNALRELGNSTSIDEALRELTVQGHVAVEKVSNRHEHHITSAGHQHWATTICEARGQNP